jgi:hypothetical protein
MLRKVSADDEFGLHGLRVQGYNDACAGSSEKLAVAHGGWQSTAHTRYARFALTDVVGLAGAMLSAAGLESADKGMGGVGGSGEMSEKESDDEGADEDGEGSGEDAAAEAVSAGGQADADGEGELAVEEQPASGLTFFSSPISSIAQRLSRRVSTRN